MKLEPIRQSEVSQKGEKKSCINTYIWNLKGWYLSTYLQGSNRDTDIENRLWTQWGERESGRSRESGIETYTLPYVKQIASGNLPCDPGSSNLVLCDNLAGWGGVGGGREFQERGAICMYG